MIDQRELFDAPPRMPSERLRDRVVVYSDGGCRPTNPGPGAIGGLVLDGDGSILASISERTPKEVTSNEAEYLGLIRTLGLAARFRARSIEVRSDSELMVRQLQGRYGVSAPGLRPLVRAVRELLNDYESVTLTHVGRDDNSRADALVCAAFEAIA